MRNLIIVLLIMGTLVGCNSQSVNVNNMYPVENSTVIIEISETGESEQTFVTQKPVFSVFSTDEAMEKIYESEIMTNETEITEKSLITENNTNTVYLGLDFDFYDFLQSFPNWKYENHSNKSIEENIDLLVRKNIIVFHTLIRAFFSLESEYVDKGIYNFKFSNNLYDNLNDYEEFVNSVYIKEYAAMIINDFHGQGKPFYEQDGVLYWNNLAAPGAWVSNPFYYGFAIEFVNIAENECEFLCHVLRPNYEYIDDISLKGKAIKEDGEWRLTHLIYDFDDNTIYNRIIES